MKKIKIQIVGENSEDNAVVSALVGWALVKFGLRPSFKGEGVQRWNQLVTDEYTLDKEFSDLVKRSGFEIEAVKTEAPPKILNVFDEDELLGKPFHETMAAVAKFGMGCAIMKMEGQDLPVVPGKEFYIEVKGGITVGLLASATNERFGSMKEEK